MGSCAARRCADERGIATVVAVGLAAVLFAVAAVAVAGIRVAVTGHQVRAAADLAALAGASALRDGEDACVAAERFLRRNDSRLTRCTVAGLSVQVTAESRTPAMAGLVWSVPATARAGPG